MSFESLTDDHEPCGTELFLDTSIHCSRLKGSLFQERISAVLKLFSWIGTSTYAKVEYGNVVLARAEYFLRKIDDLGSLEKVLDFIGNVLRHQSHRGRVLWSFNLLARICGNDDGERTERARLSLRRLMKLGVAYVEELCDQPIENGTACYWAKKGVHKRRDGKLKWKTPVCKRDNKRCRLDEFFTENQELFAEIKHAIDNLPAERKTDQLRAFAEIIGQAMADPGVLLDYKVCRRLADAIIAVDSRAYRNMFSQNSQESEILTRVLNQTFYYLPPNPAKGILVQQRE